MQSNQIPNCNLISGSHTLSSGRLSDLENIPTDEVDIEEIKKITFTLNRYEFVCRESDIEEKVFRLDFASNPPKDCLVRIVGNLQAFPKKGIAKSILFQVFPDELFAPLVLIEDETFNCVMQNVEPYYPGGYMGVRIDISGRLDIVDYVGKDYLRISEIERGIIEDYEFIKE